MKRLLDSKQQSIMSFMLSMRSRRIETVASEMLEGAFPRLDQFNGVRIRHRGWRNWHERGSMPDGTSFMPKPSVGDRESRA